MPRQIHVLDLQSAFFDHDLNELYEVYGNISVRERSLVVCHSRNPCPSTKIVPPHRRLLPTSVISNWKCVFHEPKRDVFFWYDSEDDRQVLCVQSAPTGRRLRPAIDSERFPKMRRHVSRAISTDGNHIGLPLNIGNCDPRIYITAIRLYVRKLCTGSIELSAAIKTPVNKWAKTMAFLNC